MSSYSLEFSAYFNGQWNNISDYIVSCDAIPYIDRNRDFECLISQFDFEVPYTLSALRKGDNILVKFAGQVIYSGFISSRKRIYSAGVYFLTAKSHLFELTKYYCDYDTLHSDMIANSTNINDYCPASVDNEVLSNVRVMYLLRRMFAIAGLTLMPLYDDTFLYQKIYDNRQETITLDKVAIDEFVIYAINQLYVVRYGGGSTYDQHGDSKVSFFDFLKIWCSLTGTYLLSFDYKTYWMYRRTEGNYLINDDLKYDYSSEGIDKISEDFSLVMNFGHQVGNNYRTNYNQFSTAYTPVTQKRIDEGGDFIDWRANLFFLIRKTRPVNVVDITYSSGITYVEVDDITTYTGVVTNGRHILISGVQGMTEINGFHKMNGIPDGNKIRILFTPTNAYTTGGSVDHAGTVYSNYYWQVWDTVTNGDGLKNKINLITSDYNEEEIKTDLTITVKSAVSNKLNLETLESEILQETYE